jgi:hypothetical protein
MNPDAMVKTLKSMKLYGMADAVTELSAQSSPAYKQAVPVLEMLLKAESSERERAFHQLPDEGRQVPSLPRSNRLRLHAERCR